MVLDIIMKLMTKKRIVERLFQSRVISTAYTGVCPLCYLLPAVRYGIRTMPLYFTLMNFIQHTQCVLSVVSSCMNSRVIVSARSLQKRRLSAFLASPIQHHSSRAHLGR
jgi:hypothetical protein